MAGEAGRSGHTSCVDVESRMMLNPGPLEARAGCTQPSPRRGQCWRCALCVPDARGEDVVQGNTGCSLPWIHIRRVARTTAVFRSIVSGLPDQLRGRSGAAWGLEERPP